MNEKEKPDVTVQSRADSAGDSIRKGAVACVD